MALPATEARIRVPFVDLGPSHAPVAEAIMSEISALVQAGAFTNGPQVAAFERAFADYCGTAHCVGLASGLDALRLALLAGGIEPGDEVLIPADTFIATFEAVSHALRDLGVRGLGERGARGQRERERGRKGECSSHGSSKEEVTCDGW